MNNKIKEILKMTLIVAVTIIMCIAVYMVLNNKNINLPKKEEIKEINLKEDNKTISIKDKEQIEEIYKILENKKSIYKSPIKASKDVKTILQITLLTETEKQYKMNINKKDNKYFIEESKRIFELTQKEYNNITAPISKKYTIGKLSQYDIKNDKIVMENTAQDKILIKNKTNKTYEYGEEYYIEIKKDNKWYEIKYNEEPTFNLILNVIKGHKTNTIEINDNFKEDLEKGTYRIVKAFNEEKKDTDIVYSSLEFEIK